MDTSPILDTEPEEMDELDGTAASLAPSSQGLFCQFLEPQIRELIHPSSEENFLNEQLFSVSETFINHRGNHSRWIHQLKILTVKIVGTRIEMTSDRPTETRRVDYQGCGTLLIIRDRRRLPYELLASHQTSENLKIYVQTTRDLIKDDIDALNATIYIPKDNGNAEEFWEIRGHHVYHSALPGDRTLTLICKVVTREMAELVERRKECLFHYMQQIPEDVSRKLANKSVMASYPHGRGPKVSIGDFEEGWFLECRCHNGDIRFKRVSRTEAGQTQERLWRGINHNLPTSAGSHGAPTITFKYEGGEFVHELWIHGGVESERRLNGTLLKVYTQQRVQGPVTPSRNPHAPEAREHSSMRDPQSGFSDPRRSTGVHQGAPQVYHRSRQSDPLISCVQFRHTTGDLSSIQTSSVLASTMNQDITPAGASRLDQLTRGTATQQSSTRPKVTRREFRQDLTTGQSNGHLNFHDGLSNGSFPIRPATHRGYNQENSQGQYPIAQGNTHRLRPVRHANPHGLRPVGQANLHGLRPVRQANPIGQCPTEQSNNPSLQPSVQETQQAYRRPHEIVTSASTLGARCHLHYQRTEATVTLHPVAYREELSIMTVSIEERYPTS